MDAIITAGGLTPSTNDLFPYTQNSYKSLINIDGKPMVQWVLDALSGCSQIQRVAVVGLSSDANLECAHPIIYLADQGDSIRNVCHAAHQLDGTPDELLLVISADTPAITTAMIDWFLLEITKSNHDFFYNVIQRSTMEQRYPDSHRTYVRLKDCEVCGGDMSAIRRRVANFKNPVVLKLYNARKNPLQQALALGAGFLIKLLNRQITLQQAAKHVSHRLGIHGKAVLCPYAEVGMDVDKLFQLQIIQKEFNH